MSKYDSDEKALRCYCGHTGRISRQQSDKGWGSPNTDYYITGFGKRSDTNIEKFSTFADAIAQLKPKCPACGEIVTSTGLNVSGEQKGHTKLATSKNCEKKDARR
jgi:hypothetical protein